MCQRRPAPDILAELRACASEDIAILHAEREQQRDARHHEHHRQLWTISTALGIAEVSDSRSQWH